MTENTASRRTMLKGLMALGAGAAATPVLAAGSNQTATDNELPQKDYDCVVLGCGTGGLVTAIIAAEAGAKVALLEKCDRANGNSIYAVGGLASWGTKYHKEHGIKDTREDFYKTMMTVSANRADPDLTATYVDNISSAVDWLTDSIGITIKCPMKAPWPLYERCLLIDGKGITGGSMLVQSLLKRALERKVDVFYEHKAVSLVTKNDGSVCGVIAQTPSNRIQFNARGGVVIATGGFSANQEYVENYIGNWASRLVLRGSPSVTGENITLTRPLFAKLVNMSQFHAGPIDADTHINPQAVLNSGYGFIVNCQGRRFLDEQHTYVEKAKECGQLTMENKAWQIMDSQWDRLPGYLKTSRRLNAFVAQADTFEDLCRQIDVPFDVFKKSLNEWNKAVGEGKTGELKPACTLVGPHKVEKGPFYAIPFNGGMTATYGGPKITVKAEVTNLEGKVIPGLYAVGNAAGGLFYKDYLGGSQLGGATVFGRICGREVAARAARNNK
ncbi:MAG: FAD-dependent oxidoreductase [Duodenibacillus sp.]|nr:FAD-dependent oxidoreductase [Duodenibacillus sp.]